MIATPDIDTQALAELDTIATAAGDLHCRIVELLDRLPLSARPRAADAADKLDAADELLTTIYIEHATVPDEADDEQDPRAEPPPPRLMPKQSATRSR